MPALVPIAIAGAATYSAVKQSSAAKKVASEQKKTAEAAAKAAEEQAKAEQAKAEAAAATTATDAQLSQQKAINTIVDVLNQQQQALASILSAPAGAQGFNYTPWLIGGLGFAASWLLSKKRR